MAGKLLVRSMGGSDRALRSPLPQLVLFGIDTRGRDHAPLPD